MATRAQLLLGANYEGGESFCDSVVNAIKNHFRMSDPCSNMVNRVPGEIASDSDDDKLYHIIGESGYPCSEILQEELSADKTPIFNSVDLGQNNVTMETKAKAYLSADQLNLAQLTWTKILLDTEDYDIGADFDTGNNRFTAPVSGFYQINANLLWVGNSVVADKVYYTAIWVNGALAAATAAQASHIGVIGSCVSSVEYVASGQHIELYGYHNAGVGTVDVDGGADWQTYLAIHLLSIGS